MDFNCAFERHLLPDSLNVRPLFWTVLNLSVDNTTWSISLVQYQCLIADFWSRTARSCFISVPLLYRLPPNVWSCFSHSCWDYGENQNEKFCHSYPLPGSPAPRWDTRVGHEEKWYGWGRLARVYKGCFKIMPAQNAMPSTLRGMQAVWVIHLAPISESALNRGGMFYFFQLVPTAESLSL